MSIASLTTAPTKRGPQRTDWFAKAKVVWRTEFHAGGDPFAIVAKGVSVMTVKSWINQHRFRQAPVVPKKPGPSREALLNEYFANPDTNNGRAALALARLARPSIVDLVKEDEFLARED